MNYQKTIFLVDDEPEILELVAELLAEIATVFVFSNPLEALKEIQSNRPDLLLTDQQMPHLKGTELIDRALKCCPDLCCAVLSGDIEFSEKTQLLKEKNIPHFKKPFRSIEEFVQQVKSLLENN